jgi:hypothetical protein
VSLEITKVWVDEISGEVKKENILEKDVWIGLTAKDLAEIPPSCYEGAIWADARLKEKNT